MLFALHGDGRLSKLRRKKRLVTAVIGGLHEGLGHAVGLRASDRRRARCQADLSGQPPGLVGGVGAGEGAREPFDGRPIHTALHALLKFWRARK